MLAKRSRSEGSQFQYELVFSQGAKCCQKRRHAEQKGENGIGE